MLKKTINLVLCGIIWDIIVNFAPDFELYSKNNN